MNTINNAKKYPENLELKDAIKASGIKIKHLAKEIGVSAVTLSNTINGNYKGTNIVPLIKKKLGMDDE